MKKILALLVLALSVVAAAAQDSKPLRVFIRAGSVAGDRVERLHG